ncbi:MAG: CvpA family protein [Pirellulales bacterium]|nr:CvpA family protein [Pirellulales bacterium]
MMIREGLWSNTITLFNILFSGLLAFTLYGPVAIWLDELLNGQYTYLIDFLTIWMVFSICMILLRLCTDFLSRIRVRFKKPIEAAGGPIVSLVAAWIMVGIVSASMHTAPLPKGLLGEAIVVENESDVEWALTKPHIHWLRFIGSSISLSGQLSSNDRVDALQTELDEAAKKEPYLQFCRNCTIWPDLWARMFIVKYQKRRSQFEKEGILRVNRS